jgi:hypothetical protein
VGEVPVAAIVQEVLQLADVSFVMSGTGMLLFWAALEGGMFKPLCSIIARGMDGIVCVDLADTVSQSEYALENLEFGFPVPEAKEGSDSALHWAQIPYGDFVGYPGHLALYGRSGFPNLLEQIKGRSLGTQQAEVFVTNCPSIIAGCELRNESFGSAYAGDILTLCDVRGPDSQDQAFLVCGAIVKTLGLKGALVNLRTANRPWWTFPSRPLRSALLLLLRDTHAKLFHLDFKIRTESRPQTLGYLADDAVAERLDTSKSFPVPGRAESIRLSGPCVAAGDLKHYKGKIRFSTAYTDRPNQASAGLDFLVVVEDKEDEEDVEDEGEEAKAPGVSAPSRLVIHGLENKIPVVTPSIVVNKIMALCRGRFQKVLGDIWESAASSIVLVTSTGEWVVCRDKKDYRCSKGEGLDAVFQSLKTTVSGGVQAVRFDGAQDRSGVLQYAFLALGGVDIAAIKAFPFVSFLDSPDDFRTFLGDAHFASFLANPCMHEHFVRPAPSVSSYDSWLEVQIGHHKVFVPEGLPKRAIASYAQQQWGQGCELEFTDGLTATLFISDKQRSPPKPLTKDLMARYGDLRVVTRLAF